MSVLSKFRDRNKKKYRKAYTKAKPCRCHGTCSWCKENRLHKHKKKEIKINEQLKEVEYIEEENV